MNQEMIDYTEKEMSSLVMRFAKNVEVTRASQIAKDIVAKIDWNNSALMHKGLSWIAKNYLIQQKII